MNINTQFAPEEIEAFIKAEAVVVASPLSMPMLRRLGLFLIQSASISPDSLQGTLQFVKKHRLPKAKTVAWLGEHSVESDFAVISSILGPIARIFLADETGNNLCLA